MTPKDIPGQYKFKIFRDGDFFIAKGEGPGGSFITQGKDEQEIFEMIADALMTAYEVPVK